MFWATSRLFWKIVGTYVLLSSVALVGLSVTLNSQLGVQAEKFEEDEASTLLTGFCREMIASDNTSALLNRWRDFPAMQGYRLWLVDSEGEPAVSEAHTGAPPAVIRSAVRGAVRSGASLRRLPASDSGDRVLLMAQSCEAGSKMAIGLLISDPADNRHDYQLLARAGTRAAVFTWLIGIVCTACIAIRLIGPLRSMTDNLGRTVETHRRQEMLLRISERRDELGDVARSMTALESDRQIRIDELLQAERESRRTVDLLSAVLDGMVEGVIAIDQDERILFLNAAARRVMGVSESLGVGRRVYEAIRVPAVLDAIREAVSTEQTQTLEFRSLRENLYLALVVNPIHRANWSGAVAVIRDISAQRRVESIRRDFVSGVSHELKTPLTVIQACTDTLLDGAVDQPDDARHFLKQISNQSERLLTLILGMLQLSRVESGAELFQRERMEAADVVRTVLDSFGPVAAARSVQLRQEGAAELTVTADHHALQTIISNLVDNAIKHTPVGGVVRVILSGDAATRTIVVRDSGSGIPAEHLPRIFERFYRVDRDRSRDQGGTGLGLAIVKHLCQTMKAVVSVRSEPGGGAEFSVVFPAESESSDESPDSSKG